MLIRLLALTAKKVLTSCDITVSEEYILVFLLLWNIYISYLEYTPICMLIFMFWLIIKKCTTGKLRKNSRTPEIKDMEMSLKNTD